LKRHRGRQVKEGKKENNAEKWKEEIGK